MINSELQLAEKYVELTDNNIFLTGNAGTGKTTFLRKLRDTSVKRMVVTAPTGVAAINAGGVTLHSFFQLPFGPFIPGSNAFQQSEKKRFRFSRQKRQIIESLDLLVIDEISMVRADLLDSVDAVLRRIRKNELPFGGVQLLMIGDLQQLSPVANAQDWQILSEHYESVYFFSSKALAETTMTAIELKHIYRQTDRDFVALLNQVREGRLDSEGLETLNSRYCQGFKPQENEGYITLTTHNANADKINLQHLKNIASDSHTFNAVAEGDFPEQTFPAPADLELKEGAQVMFLKNDPSPAKLYYNGKIGRVSRIDSDVIFVSSPGEEDVAVEKVTWENIKYTINSEDKSITEEVVGIFTQYPLKTAWAITIHKSQGLTFDKAIIDAGAAFTGGQVYVALSRCRSLDGIILTSRISPRGIVVDHKVLDFNTRNLENLPGENDFEEAKFRYWKRLLFECFDLSLLKKRFDYLLYLLKLNAGIIQISGIGDLQQLRTQAEEKLFAVAVAFRKELQSILSSEAVEPEASELIRERTTKASVWFKQEFINIFESSIAVMSFIADNKDVEKRLNSALDDFTKELNIRKAGISATENGFAISSYLQAVSVAGINVEKEKKKKKKPPVDLSNLKHAELFNTLRDWRTEKSAELDVAPFEVMHNRVIAAITELLPRTHKELKRVAGVGKKTIERYGDDIIAYVGDYCNSRGITEVDIEEETESKEEPEQNKSTREITFDLYKAGKSPAEIAEIRGLKAGTIERHLIDLIEDGMVDIDGLIEKEKQLVISKMLDSEEFEYLSEIKEKLGESFSYGEISMVIAYKKFASLSNS